MKPVSNPIKIAVILTIAIVAGITIKMVGRKPVSVFYQPTLNNPTSQFWPGEPTLFENRPDTIRILKNASHVNGYCTKDLNPVWTAYTITAGDVTPVEDSRNTGEEDNRLPPSKMVTNQELAESPYMLAQMAPEWALPSKVRESAQLASNGCPQPPKFTQTTWLAIEKLEAAYAKQYGELTVFCGPIFSQAKTTTAGETMKIRVPDGFYKIIMAQDQNNEPKIIAFIVPATARETNTEDLTKYLGTVRQIERDTQLRFLSKIENVKQAELKILETTLWK